MMLPFVGIAGLLTAGLTIEPVFSFSDGWAGRRSRCASLFYTKEHRGGDAQHLDDNSRRSLLDKASIVTASFFTARLFPEASQAVVGTLPEFSNTNAILQGVTVNVADQSQQDAMIKFLTDAFSFNILRQRKVGSVTDTWLGFGPEQLSIPADFTFPVSSFSYYGGHASIHVRYDSRTSSVLYRTGDAAPGDNIAYLQVGVPAYRVSQMTKNGGNVLDAYGYINVVSPSGLPMRGIVGICPDPIMFLAVNCANVEESRAFYEKLGFTQQPYPFARPSKGTGPFEPPQPPKSVYMAPSPNCMGVLLLQSKNKKRIPAPNPVFESLNLVYTPSQGSDGPEEATVVDPSGVSIALQSVERFEALERASRFN